MSCNVEKNVKVLGFLKKLFDLGGVYMEENCPVFWAGSAGRRDDYTAFYIIQQAGRLYLRVCMGFSARTPRRLESKSNDFYVEYITHMRTRYKISPATGMKVFIWRISYLAFQDLGS